MHRMITSGNRREYMVRNRSARYGVFFILLRGRLKMMRKLFYGRVVVYAFLCVNAKTEVPKTHQKPLR